MGIRAYLLRMYSSGRWYTPDGKRVLYENFDGENWDEEPGFKGLDECVGFIKDYDGSAEGRIRCLLGPSTADACSPALLRESRKHADEMGVGLQTHVSQSVVEFQEIMRRYGRTPIEFLHDVGLLGPDLIAGHSILIDQAPGPDGDDGRTLPPGLRQVRDSHGVVRQVPDGGGERRHRHRHLPDGHHQGRRTSSSSS